MSSFNRLKVKCQILPHRGVQDTRSYHCDGRSLKFKSFVYLSDVQSLAMAPIASCPSLNADDGSGGATPATTSAMVWDH